jgi:hypothetical protein
MFVRSPFLFRGRQEMEIGKPKRVYRVEPVREPVPAKQPQVAPAAPAKKTPTTVPAR